MLLLALWWCLDPTYILLSRYYRGKKLRLKWVNRECINFNAIYQENSSSLLAHYNTYPRLRAVIKCTYRREWKLNLSSSSTNLKLKSKGVLCFFVETEKSFCFTFEKEWTNVPIFVVVLFHPFNSNFEEIFQQGKKIPAFIFFIYGRRAWPWAKTLLIFLSMQHWLF